jgi:hypothetical protein
MPEDGKLVLQKTYSRLLEQVYRRWSPDKLDNVKNLLEKYKDQEDEVFEKAVRRYVFEDHPRERWLPYIVGMYKRFNREKLESLDELLAKYKDSEAALFTGLCKKYLPTLRADDPPLVLGVEEEVEHAEKAAAVKPSDDEDRSRSANGVTQQSAGRQGKAADATQAESQGKDKARAAVDGPSKDKADAPKLKMATKAVLKTSRDAQRASEQDSKGSRPNKNGTVALVKRKDSSPRPRDRDAKVSGPRNALGARSGSRSKDRRDGPSKREESSKATKVVLKTASGKVVLASRKSASREARGRGTTDRGKEVRARSRSADRRGNKGVRLRSRSERRPTDTRSDRKGDVSLKDASRSGQSAPKTGTTRQPRRTSRSKSREGRRAGAKAEARGSRSDRTAEKQSKAVAEKPSGARDAEATAAASKRQRDEAVVEKPSGARDAEAAAAASKRQRDEAVAEKPSGARDAEAAAAASKRQRDEAAAAASKRQRDEDLKSKLEALKKRTKQDEGDKRHTDRSGRGPPATGLQRKGSSDRPTSLPLPAAKPAAAAAAAEAPRSPLSVSPEDDEVESSDDDDDEVPARAVAGEVTVSTDEILNATALQEFATSPAAQRQSRGGAVLEACVTYQGTESQFQLSADTTLGEVAEMYDRWLAAMRHQQPPR